jgi:2-(1,2-epoxy-1,2-dihydrophenyl)acetyl-CoA isomerase
MSEGLRVEVRSGVGRLTFERPEVRNALSLEIVQRLGEALLQFERDPAVRCIVLTGAGEHFVGGGDVKAFGQSLELGREARASQFERRITAAIGTYRVLERIGKPVIARVRGAVAGAGIPFVLASDFAVAGESAFFVFAHRSLSLPPDGALSYFLPRIVGWRRAKQLTLLGARLDSAQALAEGIVTERVPDERLDETCEALIARLIDGPPSAFRAVIGVAERLDTPLGADLPMAVVPMEDDGGAWIFAKLSALARLVIGVKDDVAASGIDVLGEHHARRGLTVLVRGGEHHGIGIGLSGVGARLRQPLRGELDRIRGQGIRQRFGPRRLVTRAHVKNGSRAAVLAIAVHPQ